MNIAQTIKAAGKQGAHRPFADAVLSDAEYLAALEQQAQAVGQELDSESIEQGESA